MSDNYRFEVLSDKYLKLQNMTVNVILPKEMFKKWPKILKLGGMCYNKGTTYTMWVAIVEHYVLCAKKSNIRYKYLWMVEQDLGYSGNLYEFMKQYENDKVDIISIVYWKKRTSFWTECFTPEYYNWRIKYHYDYKYQSYNWITRISLNAVNKLYNEFEQGRHVANEEALPERIEPLKFTYKQINSSFDGYKFNWNTRVHADEWNKILKDPKNQNKLFHALKF